MKDRDEIYALVEAGRLPVNEQFFKDNDGESSLVHFEELEEIVVEAEPVIDSQQYCRPVSLFYRLLLPMWIFNLIQSKLIQSIV